IQGTPAADAIALRLAPDGEPVDGVVTPAVADALAADGAAPGEAGVPANGAHPASWEIPARIAADPAILSEVVGRIIESGNRLENVEYYVYALEDAEGNVRNPEKDGLPATDKGDLLKDMSAAKADERRAKPVDDAQARPAVAADEDGTIGVTRYATYHDALMVGADGVAGGRYRIALVD
ncbi:hypothetical protein OIV57_33905, partial [Burkholderia pseudomallei]